ncbi:amino acid transporter [Sinomonas sp. G460-2]|uniref:amino acid transporter n=1 Tax=Sinomonas sp. G460-2 TaxID=3393464 RepID=UPI0039F04F63
MTALSQPRVTSGSFRSWLLHDLHQTQALHQGPHAVPRPNERKHSWWQVMCLTGVDLFSSLGYAPAIAAVAAGVLSPLATILLVIVMLCGALPVYRRVSVESHSGSGSIAMLERLLSRWGGKFFVLALIGFAATDFVITMTLSAADAAAHLIANPLMPGWLQGQNVAVTLVLLALLGAVFLRGFREAIGVAVVLVGIYLGLNAILVVVTLGQLLSHPIQVSDWWHAAVTSQGNPLLMIAVALLVFPKLALGMSGFETGVAVMPQIRGDASDTEENPTGRIRGTKRLLTGAAVIMSAFLLTTSFTTVILIPQQDFQPGGPADGRALALQAHEYLGVGFGTVYDLSTIAILWFAGASAMAGLLNLVPRYLPRYGMAPQWTKAMRPLVLVFTAIGFLVTLIFSANVDAQGGAYATGVLVLMTSAAVAVTLSARRRRQGRLVVGFGIIAVAFVYTTLTNMVERPEGLEIAAIFIAAIVVVSLVSRAKRSFELHATSIQFDEKARGFLDSRDARALHVIAHEPVELSSEAYLHKLESIRETSHLAADENVVFLEVFLDDSSDFETALEVHGLLRHGYRVLEVHGPVIPNTIASVLLHIRDVSGLMPHVYFRWTEGNPVRNLLRFMFFGEGEIAPVTREVLRQAVPEVTQRPWVHVG